MVRRGWGEGSVCRRTIWRNGKRYDYWRAILPGGAGEHQGRTEREVRAWLRENNRQDRPAPRADGMTLGAYALDWLRELERTGSRPSTVSFHGQSLLRLEPLDRLPMSAITVAHLRDKIATMVERGLASRTIRASIQTLGQLLHSAEADGHVSQNVARLVKMPRLETRPARTFTTEQAAKIVSAGHGDELASLYAVGVCTGLRRGELLALTWADVDLKAHSLRVDRSKTRAGIRKIPLSEATLGILRSLERSPGPIWAYHPSTVSHDFRDFCARLDLPGWNLHSLRHTAATVMREQGVPEDVIQWILGHTKTAQTRHYTHESWTLMEDAMQRLGRAVG